MAIEEAQKLLILLQQLFHLFLAVFKHCSPPIQ
jgi:hypothetical protein